MLKEHRERQQGWRLVVRQLWEEGDWVFSNSLGQPLSLNFDHRGWERCRPRWRRFLTDPGRARYGAVTAAGAAARCPRSPPR